MIFRVFYVRVANQVFTNFFFTRLVARAATHKMALRLDDANFDSVLDSCDSESKVKIFIYDIVNVFFSEFNDFSKNIIFPHEIPEKQSMCIEKMKFSRVITMTIVRSFLLEISETQSRS